MDPSRIRGANLILTPPKDWDQEAQICQDLAVRRTPAVMPERGDSSQVSLQSAWTPTEQELERLNKGGKVVLTVYGGVHPPVWLGVEPA